MGKRYFLNVQKGEFSESRQIKERAVFNELTGHVVALTFKDTPHGETVRLQVLDEINFYMLSMFVSSRSATAFFNMSKNIDFKQPITFKITEKDGKDFLSIHQFGKAVTWYYTKDSHELPTDFAARREYLKEMVKYEVLPLIQKKINPYPNNPFFKPVPGLAGGYFDSFKSGTTSKKKLSIREQDEYDRSGGNTDR